MVRPFEEGRVCKGGQNPDWDGKGRPRPPTGSDGTNRTREIAEKIASLIMTCGTGQKAERLLMWSDTWQQDAGGWSEGPLADYIERILNEEGFA